MRASAFLSLLSGCVLPVICAAEPVAVRFAYDPFNPDDPTDPGAVRLRDYSGALPDLILTDEAEYNSGLESYFPWIDLADAGGDPSCSDRILAVRDALPQPVGYADPRGFGAGLPYPGAAIEAAGETIYGSRCLPGGFHAVIENLRAQIILGCPYNDPDRALSIPLTDVFYYPVSLESADGLSVRYGWIAVQLRLRTVAGCAPECPEPGSPFCSFPEIIYVGAGFETEAGVPVVLGGGLCEADLHPDALLDLSDVNAFVNAFVSRDAIADLDRNGIFDLTDVSAFIDAFTSGCGL